VRHGLLGLDTGRQTELSAANAELHEAIEAPEADKGRVRRAWIPPSITLTATNW